MRGGETGGKESGGNCTPRGPLPPEGTETCPETRSPRGTCRKRRRQRRKVHSEWRAQTQEGSRLTPATGGGLSAEGNLEAQTGTNGGDGAQEEPVTPRLKSESLPADESRDRRLRTQKTQERGAPPGQRLPPDPQPPSGAAVRGSCGQKDSHDPGQYGRHEVLTPRNPERGEASSHPGQHRLKEGRQ